VVATDWGMHFTFFEPVFNVADSAITIGIRFYFSLINEFSAIRKTKKNPKKIIRKPLMEL